MKIVYCPPGTDPMDVARAHRQGGRGGGGGLLQHWWIVAVAIFLGVTAINQLDLPAGGDEPQPAATTPAPDERVLVHAGDEFAGFCHNPAGGLYPPGETVWLADEDTIRQARCDNGTWKETEAAATSP